MSHEKSKPAKHKAAEVEHKPAAVEHKAADTEILSSNLHDSVYQVPDDLKRWFAFKGNKIYSEGREKWLSPNVVTWEEVRDGQRQYQGDDFDENMFSELRNYCYGERFKSKIANPTILDESTGKSYQIPAKHKQWFNQNRLAIEDSSVDNYNSETELNRTEKINGVVTLNQLRSYFENSSSDNDNSKRMSELDDDFYRQQFKSQLTKANVVGEHGYVYPIPQNLKNWFDQNRINIEKSGSDGLDGTITIAELSSFYNASSEGGDNRKKMDSLFHTFYNERFKSQLANSTVLGDNGFAHKVPPGLKSWFDERRIYFDSTIKPTYWDGKISTDELIAYYRDSDTSENERKQTRELLKQCYQQRFKKVDLVSPTHDETYELPTHLQKWLNQNAWETDMQAGALDGKVTIEELERSPVPLSNADEMVNELTTFVRTKTENDYKAAVKSFEELTRKNPESVNSWLKQHVGEIDTDNNGSLTGSEINRYSILTKNESDKTMATGLLAHIDAFGKMTDGAQRKFFGYGNGDSYFTTKDVDTAVKLATHKMTPAQLAFDNTIDQAKLGAILGAVGGGTLGLASTAGIAYNVLRSWGASSAAVALGSVARRTIGGTILGGLAGAAVTAAIGCGVNYYLANNSMNEKSKALRDAHLIK